MASPMDYSSPGRAHERLVVMSEAIAAAHDTLCREEPGLSTTFWRRIIVTA